MSKCPCGGHPLGILGSFAADEIPHTEYNSNEPVKYEWCRSCGFNWGVKDE